MKRSPNHCLFINLCFYHMNFTPYVFERDFIGASENKMVNKPPLL